MSIETLYTAARAAGYAMAAEDEVAVKTQAEVELESDAWRPSEAMLLARAEAPKAASSLTDWVKGVFGMFGRGAPA